MPLVVVCASGEFDYPCRTKKKKRKKKEDKIIRKGRKLILLRYIYIYIETSSKGGLILFKGESFYNSILSHQTLDRNSSVCIIDCELLRNYDTHSGATRKSSTKYIVPGCSRKERSLGIISWNSTRLSHSEQPLPSSSVSCAVPFQADHVGFHPVGR